MRKAILLILSLTLFLGCLQEAEPNQYSNPNALVEPNGLVQHVDDSNIKIIATPATKESYENGHIPGALYIDYTKDIVNLNAPVVNQMAPKDKVESLLRRLGIENSDTIVVYDNTNNMIAARMFNVLKFYGHKDIRLLNGGKNSWTGANGELTTTVPPISPSEYSATDKNSKEYVNLDYVYNNLNNPDIQIVDVRPTDQYTGENVRPGIGRDGGHIPGAINAPGGSTWNEDKTIKSYEELKEFYESRGVSMDKKVIVYCHNGMLASYSWYVLSQLVGHPDIAVFDGSSLEWSNHPDTPLVKGSDPGVPPSDLKSL
jgi:thiosulfate/3-mercaptopyruvate sulfurtransferase